MRQPPLLVVVGPTGVGKTAVVAELARRVPIEVVSADSRQVYRGMDIGTGKPSRAERGAVRHHLIDVADPDERYDVARFRAEALEALQGIAARGGLPAVVGGTGLYVRALLKGLRPGPPADPALRRSLEGLADTGGAAALYARLRGIDPARAARLHPNDRVRLVRALEVAAATGGDAGRSARSSPAREPSEEGEWASARPPWRLLMVGLSQARAALDRRLAARVRAMVSHGIVDEVRGLIEAGYDEAAPAMNGIGYRQFCAVLRGRLTEDDALRLMIRDTKRYARRQATWFARDPEIQWIDVDAAGGLEGAAEQIHKRIERAGLRP